MRLIDLTTTLDPANRDLMPPHLQGMAGIIAPKIKYLAPDSDEGRDRMCSFFGCNHADLLDGEGWGAEVLGEMSSHCGTHVDAPLHSGSTSEGRLSRTVDAIDLNELFCPGMVLDVREWVSPSQAISIDALQRAIRATGREIQKGDAVLIRTGQERYTMADELFFMYPGMSREGTLFLSGQGATVLGTDAMAWDRPFKAMALAWRESGDNRHLWDGHKAVREKEAFIIQQLHNLAALPLSGFQVGFFPLKLKAASAAPARVVAFLPA